MRIGVRVRVEPEERLTMSSAFLSSSRLVLMWLGPWSRTRVSKDRVHRVRVQGHGLAHELQSQVRVRARVIRVRDVSWLGLAHQLHSQVVVQPRHSSMSMMQLLLRLGTGLAESRFEFG